MYEFADLESHAGCAEMAGLLELCMIWGFQFKTKPILLSGLEKSLYIPEGY